MFRRSFRGDQGTNAASSVMLAFLQADDARYFGQQKSKRNREKRIEKNGGRGRKDQKRKQVNENSGDLLVEKRLGGLAGCCFFHALVLQTE